MMTAILSFAFIFFFALAPLLPSGMRRGIACALGIIGEVFSVLPFGLVWGIFLVGTGGVEILERALTTREPAGWAATSLSVIAGVAFLQALALVIVESIPLTLAVALFVSELVVGVIIIGFLWVPIKLSMRRQ